MPEFDSLRRASFDGIEFPVKRVSIKGRYRHHEHEYLRVPGAVIEKLERSVYNIEMEAAIDVNIRGYGTLWPDGINALQKKYESGTTGPLVIPTIGTIPAFQPEWDRTADMARLRSGELLKLSFKEDQTERFVQLALVKTQQQSVQTSTDALTAKRLLLGVVPPGDANLFDQIVGAANSVLAIKDQADLYGGLLAAKLARLTNLMNQADKQLESLKHPENSDVLDAFLELWNAGVNMATNLAESPRGPKLWTVPRLMSVGDIASAIYGSTERANEIMLNNRLSDPFQVTAGTKIIYFEDAGLIAA